MAKDATFPEPPAEDRFSRLEAIPWWDRSVVQDGRVLVVGAGALGNEVLKNLALLGIGHLAIVDLDRVEDSNLSRSVLFRSADNGQPKATVAARAVASLCPEVDVTALVGDVLADVGLGYFRWAHVIVGCLDNREARVFVNRTCAQVSRPWIDGGIDVLSGIVRGFAPPDTACYECTMGEADWNLLNRRRSCSLLARKAMEEGGTPTTPTTASVIGAVQAQEVLKHLHGLQVLAGRGYVFEGLAHNSYTVEYPVAPDCPWHEPPAPVRVAVALSLQSKLSSVWRSASDALGGLDALDLARELVDHLECPACGHQRRVSRPIQLITEDQALCERCSAEAVPHFLHSVGAGSPLLDRTVGELGLPPWDIVWGRYGEQVIGIELAQDRPAHLCGD